LSTKTSILVTGGTGFLGRHIVWRLAEAGHDITFTGRNAKAAFDVQKHCNRPVSFIQLEHGKPEATQQLCAASVGMSAVVHSAALSSPWGHREAFEKANVASTAEVIAACQQNKIEQLVHISTPSIYFDYTDKLNIPEHAHLPTPVNAYAATKLEAETLVRGSGLSKCVILRPRALFGPWDNTLLPRLMRAMQKGRVPLPRNGQALLDITYIDNAVDAVQLALTSQLKHNVNIYNVSNGTPIYLLDLLKLISNSFNVPLRTLKIPHPLLHKLAHVLELVSRLQGGQHEPLMTRYSAGVLAFSQTLDLAAIRQDLGYAPRISIEEGMKRHAAWYAGTQT